MLGLSMRLVVVIALFLVIAKGPANGATPATTQADPGLKLGEVKKKEDSVKIWRDGEVTMVQITSVSGIGKAELRRTGERWPKEIHIVFRDAGGKPFQYLEMLHITIQTDKHQDLWKHPGDKLDPKKVIVVKIPGDAGGTRLIIDWIDAWRR